MIKFSEIVTGSHSYEPYNSKVIPIQIGKNMARDQRIYLLLIINKLEAIAYNRQMKKVGFLSQDEISAFFEENVENKTKTEEMVAPDDENICGLGHFYDSAKREGQNGVK